MTTNIEKLLQNDVILDACSVYSLYATSRFDEILRWIPGQVYIASHVERNEVKQLYNPATGASDIEIDLSKSKTSGLLLVTKPAGGGEALDAVNFAAAMSKNKPGKNTGEAITGAIAKARKWTMVTDDVDATGYLAQQGLDTTLITTLHVLECWSSSNCLPLNDVQRCLELIRVHARYKPPKAHPLFSWWQSFGVT